MKNKMAACVSLRTQSQSQNIHQISKKEQEEDRDDDLWDGDNDGNDKKIDSDSWLSFEPN